jgi:DNA-binding transcriptional MerR regulator
MSEPYYSVGAAAEVAKVTVRTLHHYDEIGLLRPSGRSRAGYRQYTRADLERLQQVRFHRHLGLSLEEIRAVLDAPGFDAEQAWRQHRDKLVARIEETRALVATIDSMLAASKGDHTVSTENLFDGFQPEKHAAEAEERWGDSAAWRESKRRTSRYGPDQWRSIHAEHDAIVRDMAELAASGAPPDGAEAMALAERHRRHIDRWFYACSPAMHAGLGSLYVEDARFAETFERHGEGLATWVVAAIRANAAGPEAL